ncbi:uncharacterized protein N7498_002523 [Penicillium cinerascens]|uniref:Xylanolytic transcriptional activator regulatory domain-containing protein n=1 Tax=Penicillium cinerascens TaxID=70096 RepID=A0A9W9NA63_9EURO|nr:uncharacterized protein N7498_002523 [Penicillium cinerascens]KAJ5216116.1 hypothetical protein N7498_002523 [Penicillium cinerascens]
MFSFAIAGTILQRTAKILIGQNSSITPTNPFEGVSHEEANGISIIGHLDEIPIPPAITENALSIPMHSLSESQELSAIKGLQDHGSPYAIARGDLNNEFLNMIFSSSHESQLPVSSLSHQTMVYSSGEGHFESSPIHAIANDGSTSRSDATYQGETRMQAIWPGRSQRTSHPQFWHDIAFGSSSNIFATYNSRLESEASNQTRIDGTAPEISLSDDCKGRLRGLKRNFLVCGCNNIFDDGAACERRYLCINTTDILDQGLYLYAHKYQPAYPILHTATFNPENVPELLLFVMCMIGASFLKTEEAAAFIRNTYPAILNEVYARVISATVVSQTPVDILGDLVLAHHMLFLFISTGVHSLSVNLPQLNDLYEASNCHRWSQLLTETSTNNNILELSSHHFSLPDLRGPIHAFSMYGLLCSVLLRVSADIYRLVSSSDIVLEGQHHHIPWGICQFDKRANIAAPLLTSLIRVYDQTLRNSNPNCIVIWHSVCILLTVDVNVLARAAGRDGPESMTDARRILQNWTNTAASRRACLHAVQVFRTLAHRKPADGTAFQSVRTLFMSALLLGLYILLGPDSIASEHSDGSSPLDLANPDIDWKAIGNVGMSDPVSSPPSAESVDLEDASIRFIRHGGPIIIDGKNYRPGPRHAKRIILDFAGLLDEVGTYWMADYARLLYMIHDTMAEPTGAS